VYDQSASFAIKKTESGEVNPRKVVRTWKDHSIHVKRSAKNIRSLEEERLNYTEKPGSRWVKIKSSSKRGS